MNNYQRVIPRDFFNEAKLLKCMGHLALKILDGLTPYIIVIDECGDPFEIELTDDGSLYVSNYTIKVKGVPVRFHTTYNSKAAYPFYLFWDWEEILVFDESGEFTPEFIEFSING